MNVSKGDQLDIQRESAHTSPTYGIGRSVMVLGFRVLYSISAFMRGAGDMLARDNVRYESSVVISTEDKYSFGSSTWL